MVTVKYTEDGDTKVPLSAEAEAAPPPTYAQVVAGRGAPSAATPSNPATSAPAAPAPAPSLSPAPVPSTAPSSSPSPAPSPALTSTETQGLYTGRPRFGPTPLGATSVTVLPYYDPRSEWAMGTAASRAKRRLIEGMILGILIWIVVGGVVGGTLTLLM